MNITKEQIEGAPRYNPADDYDWFEGSRTVDELLRDPALRPLRCLLKELPPQLLFKKTV